MFENSLFTKVQIICLSDVLRQVIEHLRPTVGKRSLPCFRSTLWQLKIVFCLVLRGCIIERR